MSVEPWSEEFDELAALMEEDVVGENFGHAAGRLVYESVADADGLAAPPSRRSLNTATRAAREFARQGSAETVRLCDLSLYGGRGYDHAYQVVNADEWDNLDGEGFRDEVLALLGTTPEEYAAHVDVNGRPNAEAEAVRARFEERLLQVKEAGGRMTLLARCLDWPVRPTNHGHACKRMQAALKRARKRREVQAAG